MDRYHELRLFLHLTETLNFGRTSTDCHVSAATLTRSIQRLEAQAGQRLLDRGPRGVALTEPGRRFREYARSALQLWEDYHQGSGEPAGLSGRLSVFSSVTACQALLPDLLAGFRADHPQVELDLQTGDAAAAIARLAEGAVDLAVAALPRRIPEQLLSKEVARTPLVFVAAEGAAYPPVTGMAGAGNPPSWADVPFVLPRRGLARDAVNRWLRSQRLIPRIASEVDGHEALLTLVALGCGVGIVPRLVLTTSAVRDRVVEVPAEPALTGFRIGLCVRRSDLRRPLVSALWSSVLPAGLV
ncbi:HTH-type transcriptional activator IlvY [Actinopolymorpha alba]|uniref:HTH-type transcriptional activator IlvY n=1 Tax=Actinopolymorpha alba TaxID=533267 RepID=UPI000363586F|nr:HTH-type transcriptional activator IlvY [Actinopolymorpha alba]